MVLCHVCFCPTSNFGRYEGCPHAQRSNCVVLASQQSILARINVDILLQVPKAAHSELAQLSLQHYVMLDSYTFK